MSRSHNFSGGPGALPDVVLEQTQAAIREVPGTRLSLLGLSHRSAWFEEVVAEAESHFRTLLALPRGYHVLFLQGGSTQQFAQIPMTLAGDDRPAPEYLNTGYWSQKAVAEARTVGSVHVAWDGAPGGFRRLPSDAELTLQREAAYFHYVSNETVEGLQFHRLMGRNDVRRVCDMSSDFLSRPVDASQFALIYAHAQKNLGPSGVTVVVLRDDIVRAVPDGLPSVLDYRKFADAHSVYNTPPVFSIYVTLLIARWLRQEIGGLAAMAEINAAKAARLYDALDHSDGFYRGRAERDDRSLMNVAFNLPTPALERQFLRDAEAEGLFGLDGHRSIGGIRASLYNAVTLDSVNVLVDFMQRFQMRTGSAHIEHVCA